MPGRCGTVITRGRGQAGGCVIRYTTTALWLPPGLVICISASAPTVVIQFGCTVWAVIEVHHASCSLPWSPFLAQIWVVPVVLIPEAEFLKRLGMFRADQDGPWRLAPQSRLPFDGDRRWDYVVCLER